MTNLGERESRDTDPVGGKPPWLGSWKNVYWFVAIFFFVEVAIFYLFTRFYS